uniref:Acyl_transf_3 domain-containing protein n=1 Tax=Syphacia muris TaxID=451379 RepID=A0A158R3W6_9BILA
MLSIIKNFIENLDEFRHDISSKFSNLWITNSFLAVDVFFVLGGAVNSYGWFNKIQKLDVKPSWRSVGYWLRFYLHRALRVWPVYAHTLFMYSYFNRLHHHEVLPTDNPISQCSKYWWHNLLFINSLTGAACAPHTWYMSAEFIFYLLSPTFLLALLKSTVYALTLVVTVIALSAACTVHSMITYNLSPTLLHWSKPPIFNASPLQHFLEIYIKPQYRIGPYLIGILLGYFLSLNTRPKLFDSKRIRYTANFIATICACYSFFGLYPIVQGFNWPLYYLIFGALHRTIFGLSVAWLIYACHSGLYPALNAFFSNRLFFILAGLSYSVQF